MDVTQVMQWKLGRGKFRPLMGRLEGNSEAAVVACSEAAFSSKSLTPKARVKEITKLAAIGPATASAVLEVFAPHEFAFFADEAVDATSIGRDYTLPRFLEFNALMISKATELGPDWTAATVSRALWARAKCDVYGIALSSDGTPQRGKGKSEPASKRRKTK
jgi:hypothetical protein